MRTPLLIATLAFSLAASALAQGNPQPQMAPEGQAVITTPDALPWGPAPATMPAGAKVAVLQGDPAMPGPFTLRISVPDGYRVPPHYHPMEEHLTVISGTFQFGMGETFDATKLATLPAGTFGLIPPGVKHFAQAKGATVVQLHGVGPWKLIYVNPADQPK